MSTTEATHEARVSAIVEKHEEELVEKEEEAQEKDQAVEEELVEKEEYFETLLRNSRQTCFDLQNQLIELEGNHVDDVATVKEDARKEVEQIEAEKNELERGLQKRVTQMAQLEVELAVLGTSPEARASAAGSIAVDANEGAAGGITLYQTYLLIQLLTNSNALSSIGSMPHDQIHGPGLNFELS